MQILIETHRLCFVIKVDGGGSQVVGLQLVIIRGGFRCLVIKLS